MKIYILTKDSTRCFSNGTELHFNDQFVCICTDLNTAKKTIDHKMLCCVDFREKSSYTGRSPYDEEVYTREYEDIRYTGDSEIFRIRVKEIDDIPEVKENEGLKKSVKDLEKQVVDLKTRLNTLTGSSATFKEKSSEKKEETSYVRKW